MRFHFGPFPQARFASRIQLTSFAGAIVLQLLFRRLDLLGFLPRQELRDRSPSHGLLLIVHLLLGFRRLRDMDYYRDDPVVLRLLGLRRLPDVATLSRALARMGRSSIEKVRHLSALQRERFPRLTLERLGDLHVWSCRRDRRGL